MAKKNLSLLTPREREVLKLIAQGMSNGEIASRLVHQRAHRKEPRKQHLPQVGDNDRTRVALLAREQDLAEKE